MPRLTERGVEGLWEVCLYKANDALGGGVEVPSVVTEGSTFNLHRERLRRDRGTISDYLACLPDEYRMPQGRSFLDAAWTRDVVRWTTNLTVVDHLFMLGVGVRLVEVLGTRESWARLPGGMPNVVVKL